MATDDPRQKKARTRSPAYPYLALPEALERTAQLRRAEGRHAVSVSVAMQHWGYKAESSTGYSCIAALKKFGLVDEEGVGEDREVRLSSLALAILLDGDEGSPERAEALRTAALNPRIHAELWERYGPELPSDQTLRRFLILEKNFNETAVDEFIAEYRATVAYAGLSGTVAPEDNAPFVPSSPSPVPSSPPRRLAGPRRASTAAGIPTLPGLEGSEAPPPPPASSDWSAISAPAASVPNPTATSPGLTGDVPSGPARVGVAPVRTPTPNPASDPAAAGAFSAPAAASRELAVPLDGDLVARVPYPMSAESFALLIDTLQLWQKRLVRPSA